MRPGASSVTTTALTLIGPETTHATLCHRGTRPTSSSWAYKSVGLRQQASLDARTQTGVFQKPLCRRYIAHSCCTVLDARMSKASLRTTDSSGDRRLQFRSNSHHAVGHKATCSTSKVSTPRQDWSRTTSSRTPAQDGPLPNRVIFLPAMEYQRGKCSYRRATPAPIAR